VYPNRAVLTLLPNRLEKRVSFPNGLTLFCRLPLLLFLSLFYCSAVVAQAPPVLHSDTLAASGEQSSLLTIPRFGRYAVTVKSDQGVALQLVDRMTGPAPISGTVGEKDGRIDQFLERGDYKIITYAHEKGQGKLKLSAHPFTELHPNKAPRLLELKPVHDRLEDFQQISYWLEIKQRRAVAIEAAGRSLADMRLWKDGDWLVEALPQVNLVTPVTGKPLNVYQLNTYLEPGLYLLTLYGGVPQVWSESSDEQPLYLRFGIPKLNVADRRSRRISPFGIDRWLVPTPANYFRLALPEAKEARLGVADYQENNAFVDPYSIEAIDKKSLPPAVEIFSNNGNGYQVVTVAGESGQAYTLQHFEQRYSYSFSREGDYWISTLHSGTGQDSIDASSILTARPYGQQERLLDSRAVLIDHEKSFQRRFNLLDTLTLYLNVPQLGRYRVSGTGDGVEAQYKIEPFLTSRPYGYRSPPYKTSGETWELDPGFYELTIEPKLKGILNLNIQAEGLKASPKTDKPSSVSSGNRYPKVDLEFRTSYQLYLNHQPGVKAGLLLRELPIDLDQDGLPVDQRAGEKLEIPIKVSETGVIRAIDTNGQALPLSIDNAAMVKAATIKAGQFKVRIDNAGQDTISYSLDFEPARLAPDAPLPNITVPDDSQKPRFPELSNAKPAYFDVEKNQTATYNVLVTKPALYRLETSGLLNTDGNLRTRTQLSLVRRTGNGVGRNFLIQQYLREGDYQLSIKTQGESQGHTKLSLQQTKLIDNGQLLDDIVARYTLEANRGLAYRFTIREAGHYHIQSLSPGGVRNVRLEDAQGWPIITPNTPADFTHDFKPGEYRLIILPSDTETRVISRLQKIPDKLRFEGHGPHPLPLQQNVQHLWLEPGDGKPRTPDAWNFTLPALADTSITLDNEMGGELVKLNGHGASEKIAQLNSIKSWNGRLEQGDYRLLLRNQRKNNRVEYNLVVATKQLLPGETREIGLPIDLPLSAASDNLVELSAFAGGDVRATLFNEKEQLIAKNDDRSDDWNFLIARHLDAGLYRLHIESLDPNTRQAQVSFHVPAQKEETALTLATSHKFNDNALHLFPLVVPKDKTLLTVTANCNDNVGIALELKQGENWQVLGSSIDKKARLLLALDDKQSAHQLRLRSWSVDRRGAEIELRADAFNPDVLPASTRQVTLEPLAKYSPFAVAAIAVSQPGVFTLDSQTELLASGKAMQLLRNTATSPIVADAGTLWLASESSIALTASIKRVSLQTASPLQLTLPQSSASFVDVDAEDGPLLMLAESRSGQVGMQLLEQLQPSNNQANISFSERGMISALLSPRKARAKLWNAGMLGEALEVGLNVYRFGKPSVIRLNSGVTDDELLAMSARRYSLADGVKHLQLALPAHTAAILSSNGIIDRQFWSGDNPINIDVKSAASQLDLLHAGTSKAQTRLQLNSLSQEDGARSGISANQLYRQSNARSGIQLIPVILDRDNPRYTLRIRGAAEVKMLQDDGVVLRGENLTLNRGGMLQIRYQPGLVMAWLETRETLTSSSAKPLALDKPITVELRDGLPAQQLNTSEAVALHLYSETPLITRLRHAGGAEQVQAYPNGVAADIYLPAGTSQLTVTAISGQALTGKLNLSVNPLINIGEGSGPERLLAAGGGQLFSFTLPQTTTVGIGLQASSDLIHAQLMNAAGDVIANGVVQMIELKAGRYVLAVYAPAEDQPVRVRPVLVGSVPKEKSPPLEVIRQYLQAAGVKMNEEGAE